jgi:hypothetical protein
MTELLRRREMTRRANNRRRTHSINSSYRNSKPSGVPRFGCCLQTACELNRGIMPFDFWVPIFQDEQEPTGGMPSGGRFDRRLVTEEGKP